MVVDRLLPYAYLVAGELHLDLSRRRVRRFQRSARRRSRSFSHIVRPHRVVVVGQGLLVETDQSHLLYAGVCNRAFRSQAVEARHVITHIARSAGCTLFLTYVKYTIVDFL